MTWQELAVLAIVSGAVLFLVGRLTGRRRRGTPAETFVPLSSLKRPGTGERDDDRGCH